MMNRSARELWQAVHHERHMLVADLESLRPEQWRTASLCPGWDVHDVLAHLVDTAKTTRLGFIRRMVAARFDFDNDNASGVAREKATDPQETLAGLRAVMLRTSTPPVALATRLVEAFVHGEDIRRPLGLVRQYPPVHVATALAHQLKTSVMMGGGRERAEGWHLTATDVAADHGAGFTQGTGSEVRGSAIALLLAVSGRPATAHALGGSGAAAFADRLEHLRERDGA